MSLAEALARRRAMESGEIWASDVHEGRLWLGAGRDARNLSSLNVHAITHVLNCADDVPNCKVVLKAPRVQSRLPMRHHADATPPNVTAVQRMRV